MPLYEYSCKQCRHRFEALVRGDETPACPSCASSDLERHLSTPAVQSAGTRSQAMRAARRRDAGQAKDRMQDRLHYEKSHDRHG